MSQEGDKESNTQPERQTGVELQQHQIGSEFAKALQDLAKGERTASALENQLDGIEGRINQLLASMEGENSYRAAKGETPVEKPVSEPK